MEDLGMLQILIISAFAFWGIVDGLSWNVGFNNCIMASAFTGIMVGNLEYGLIVGGTLQLTQLGVGTYGGATVLDIKSAGMITTALGASSGLDPVAFASSLGVGIASLLTLLDILARSSNTVFQHACDKFVEAGDFKKIHLMNTLGVIPWGLSRGLPVLIFLIFGGGLADTIMNTIPAKLITGFSVAGGVLPAVGFAILMRYLPVKSKPHYLVLGFVLSAYLGMPVLGISLIGGIIAFVVYENAIANSATVVVTGGDDYDE